MTFGFSGLGKSRASLESHYAYGMRTEGTLTSREGGARI